MRGLLFCCLLIALPLTTPIAAREWNAREGGFSVQAELLDVRDGAVVLKRDDNGKEISVPLDKLSLEDVRYVHAELARLTNAINGGGSATMPAPAASTPDSSFSPPRAPTSEPSTPATPATAPSTSSFAAPAAAATDALLQKDENGYPITPRANVTAPPVVAESNGQWQASADPNPLLFTLPAEKKVKARSPKNSGLMQPQFAEHPSQFVFLEESGRKFYAFHLPTLKVVGNIELESFSSYEKAFSADGRYFAVSRQSGYPPLLEVDIWSFATGKVVQSFRFKDEARSIEALRFAGTDRIVMVKGGTNLLECFDIKSGQKLCEAKVPSINNGESLAVSPGGSFAAVFNSNNKKAELYDLRSGAEVGVVGGENELPKYASLLQLSFSPDGEELLLFCRPLAKRHLSVWSMRTGERVIDLNFDDDPTKAVLSGGSSVSYRGRPVEWRPDRSGWLFSGRVLVERGATNVVWADRESPTSYDAGAPRRFVDNDRILAFLPDGPLESTMSLLTISNDDIAATRDLIASGGTAVDYGLPALTQPKFGQVREIDDNNQWTYQPDVAPQTPEANLKNSIKIKATQAQLASLDLCRAGNYAVIGLAETDSKQRLTGLNMFDPQYFELVSLADGQAVHRLALPAAATLRAVAATGDWGAFDLKKGNDRVDVYDLTSGKSVAAFRPFEADGPKVVGMAFGSKREHLWIMDDDGELTQWKLPDCQAVARHSFRKGARIHSSPSGRTLCVISQDSIDMFDADAATMLGTLAAPTAGRNNNASYIAFSDDGRRLAMSRNGLGVQKIILWDLVGNNVAHMFDIPFFGYGISWSSDIELLVDVIATNPGVAGVPRHLVAVDLPSERVGWHYLITNNGRHGFRGSDGRHWYVSGDAGRSDSMLRGVTLPQRDDMALIGNLQRLPPVLGPGSSVDIRVIGGIPAFDPKRPNVMQEVQDAIKRRATDLGYRVQPGADFVLTVNASEAGTSESVNVREIGNRLATTTIPITEITTTAKLTDRQGKDVWSATNKVRTSVGIINTIPQGVSLTDYFRRNQWTSATGWMMGVPLPEIILDPAASVGVGISTLSPSGCQQQKTMPPINKSADKAI
ncbi:SHD1 domain-containing protein [Blastopirellula marina]|uniref:SLA1 homology domain-containing protein n=1 Tax=Blastopirellula marina TaxID=124 RepID=A0A2S8FSJ8_9BACT|nr:SHD1 domain-containing protein [Blastopirellula marina]PQO35159.1 hypothetical protein C5Y98_14505 [Blastopirellula marina]PTL43908.1 hypothetical protein C5Y97_14515 [Blastopirellula marina]